jgi:hypothetical protein
MFDFLKNWLKKDKSPDAEPVPLDLGADGRYGIQTLTPMMEAILNLGIAIAAAGQDGLSWKDAFSLAGPIMDAGGTFKNVGQAKVELLDLTPSETHTLVLILSARLPELPSNKAAIIIEAALACAPTLVHFVQTVILTLGVPNGLDIPKAVEVRAEPQRIHLPQPAPVPAPQALAATSMTYTPAPGASRAEIALNTPVAPGSQPIPKDQPPRDAAPTDRLGDDAIPG